MKRLLLLPTILSFCLLLAITSTASTTPPKYEQELRDICRTRYSHVDPDRCYEIQYTAWGACGRIMKRLKSETGIDRISDESIESIRNNNPRGHRKLKGFMDCNRAFYLPELDGAFDFFRIYKCYERKEGQW